MMRREIGLQRPLAQNQLLTIMIHPTLTFLFYYLFALFSTRQSTAWALFSIHLMFASSVLVCWFYIELTDPSDDARGIGCLCMDEAHKTSHYCSMCQKNIPGFDHHCNWLNTCIGRRNYFFFYALSLAGLAQYIVQVIFGLNLLTTWYGDSVRPHTGRLGSTSTVWGLTIFFIIFSILVAGAFASLWSFHTFLLCRGQGTIGWIASQQAYIDSAIQSPKELQMAQVHRETVEKRRQLEREEWLARREARLQQQTTENTMTDSSVAESTANIDTEAIV